MSTNDFIDRLELELRAAGRRRVRLELARVPRVPAGTGVLVLAAVICVAVAVPLLAAHSRSSVSGNPPAGGGSPLVIGCSHTVSGQLPAGWRSSRAGTVVTGPVAWLFLVHEKASQAQISRTGLVQALAVVDPGRDVTVSVPHSEAGSLSLDYTDISPRSHFRLSDGVSAVTFRPCPGPVGQTQFDGGFVLTRARCAALSVHVVGSDTSGLYLVPLGRSCPGSASGAADRRVLTGDGVGPAAFGASSASVTRRLDGLLGRQPSRAVRGRGNCGITHEVDWPGLETYFHRRRFVGYSYGSSRNEGIQPNLTTARGLQLGDTVKQGRRLYGSAFRVSPAQGGSWSVRTRRGRLDGFLSDITSPKGKVTTIEAGNVGCPALTP